MIGSESLASRGVEDAKLDSATQVVITIQKARRILELIDGILETKPNVITYKNSYLDIVDKSRKDGDNNS